MVNVHDINSKNKIHKIHSVQTNVTPRKKKLFKFFWNFAFLIILSVNIFFPYNLLINQWNHIYKTNYLCPSNYGERGLKESKNLCEFKSIYICFFKYHYCII